MRVRRDTPRLPPATEDATGAAGRAGAPELRLLTLGESTVDGVGVDSHTDGLTGRLAIALAGHTGRRVHWLASGRTGANARRVRRELLDSACAAPADAVVIALGVNDTIELRSPAAFRRDMLALVVAVRARLGRVPVMLAGVPPMDAFPTLPQPLRTVLGLRSRALDAQLARLSQVDGVWHVPAARAALRPEHFAADGFHPGAHGYRIWGEQLAGELARLV
ncbi:SGNH/GDSL hydrolase family protein [Herbihabitans rhizosphaerae]|nr:SGNH/GDSL hydrolase family protein [Herbihabitans rhizosphaerae]